MMTPKTVDIDGVEVTLYKMPAAKALHFTLRMGFLAPLIESLQALGEDESKQMQALGEAIEGMLGSTEKAAEVESFIKDIIASGTIAVNGKKIHSIDDLNRIEGTEPLALIFGIVVQQIMYSIKPGMGKLMASLGGSIGALTA